MPPPADTEIDPAPPPAPARGAFAPRRTFAAAIPLALADIKLAHSVFALPFALLAAFLAGIRHQASGIRPEGTWARFALQLALILLCMVAARTFAMLINRLADRRFDAANPRTARRPLASGALSIRAAAGLATASAAIFILAAALFYPLAANPWPLLLSLPTLAWIALYSFTKRFTALSHLFLGGALAASPIAAAIAIDPATLNPASPHAAPAIWLLAAMVIAWVAGFDIIYALQDIDFDRAAGLHSIPARLGWRRALWVSRALHVAAVAALVAAWRLEPRFGALFAAGIAAVAALLIAEHLILARRGRAGLHMAFFTLNGAVSCLLGAAGIADVMI